MTRAVAALFLGALLMAAPATADEKDVNLPEAQRNALQEAALKLAGFQAADLMFEGTAMGVPDEEPVTPEPEVRPIIEPSRKRGGQSCPVGRRRFHPRHACMQGAYSQLRVPEGYAGLYKPSLEGRRIRPSLLEWVIRVALGNT